jgi:hypothetical protein
VGSLVPVAHDVERVVAESVGDQPAVVPLDPLTDVGSLESRASERRRGAVVNDATFEVSHRQIEPVEQRPDLLEQERRAVSANHVDDTAAQANIADKPEREPMPLGGAGHVRCRSRANDRRAESLLIVRVMTA